MLNNNGEITLPYFTPFDTKKESMFIIPSDMTFLMRIHIKQ